MHSDLNPKNLLLDPDTLALTGVLDWEFAHAGHPFTDLGNLLRFDRDPAFVEAVLDGVRDRRGTPPEDGAARWPGPPTSGRWSTWRPRRTANPVADRADRLLRAIAADPQRPCLARRRRARQPKVITRTGMSTIAAWVVPEKLQTLNITSAGRWGRAARR